MLTGGLMGWVRDRKTGTKLLLIVLLEVVGIAAIVGVALVRSRTDLMDERARATRGVVETVHGVLVHYEALARAGTMPDAQARAEAMRVVQALRYAGSEYFWINDMQARMLAHPSAALVGTDMSETKDPDGRFFMREFIDVVKARDAGFVFYQWPKPGATKPVRKVSYVKGFAPWGWIVGSGVYLDDVDAAFRRHATVLVIVTVLVLAVTVAVAVGLALLLTRPLAEASKVLDAVAAGDLTRRLDVDARDEVGRMASAMNRAVDGMRATLVEVQRAAHRTGLVSQELSTAAEQLSGGAQQQASSLEETAASLEQITGTVKQNAESAQQARQLAADARDVAEQAGDVVASAVEAMGAINGASQRIADIVTTIDEIAFQTNLLALNAAVEAARAGEQGRGFAVVAAEVRNLAQRASTAAKQIKDLIHDSGVKVETGSALVNRSGDTFEAIVTSVKRVTDIVSEIAVASAEQSTGVDQVNRAVTQMDQVTQMNASQTDALSASARTLAEQGKELEALVGRFELGASAALEASAAVRVPGSAGRIAPAAPRPRVRGTHPSTARERAAAPDDAGRSLVRR